MLSNSFYNIVSSTQLADGSYRYEVSLDGRHEIFKGHFPKLPVLPGVCILQIVKDIVEDIVGYKLRLRQASNVKFMSLIMPDSSDNRLTFVLNISRTDDTSWVVKNTTSQNDITVVKLTNIYQSV